MDGLSVSQGRNDPSDLANNQQGKEHLGYVAGALLVPSFLGSSQSVNECRYKSCMLCNMLELAVATTHIHHHCGHSLHVFTRVALFA